MTEVTPWKAAADVFVVTRPTDEFIASMKEAAADLHLASQDPSCRFYPQVRVVDSPRGPAVVVTDIAEYTASGAKKSAVVISGVVANDDAGRSITVQTHLEDQHTRFDGDVIIFDEHHDIIRAAFIDAIRGVEPDARHVDSPRPPRAGAQRRGGGVSTHAAGPSSRRAGVPELGSVAGIGLLGIGVVLLLVAVASGSLGFVALALALTVLLGVVGSRLTAL